MLSQGWYLVECYLTRIRGTDWQSVLLPAASLRLGDNTDLTSSARSTVPDSIPGVLPPGTSAVWWRGLHSQDHSNSYRELVQ
jgi:hypothetical protein